MSRTQGPETFLDPAFSARIRAREPQALEATVKAYLSHILRAARGAGLNEEQSRDAAQEVFKTFIETAERFEGRSHVRTCSSGSSTTRSRKRGATSPRMTAMRT